MNDDRVNADDQLTTAVKKSLAEFEMTIPEDQIISRGHSARARRRVRRFAGAALATGALATGLAAAAVAAPVTRPHSAGQAGFALTAWTVKNQANGTVTVTIRELRDRAGLERKLRAEGIPISIVFDGEASPPCAVYIMHVHGGTMVNPGARVIQYGSGKESGSPEVLTIQPSFIPAHAGIQVFLASPASYARYPAWAIGTALVHASPQCTGS
jgi:hypothetical protein